MSESRPRLVWVAVAFFVPLVAAVAFVIVSRSHHAAPVTTVTSATATATATSAKTAAPAASTAEIESTAPVATTKPRPPWLTKVLELPSNPDAVKPTSVEEGTGKVLTVGRVHFTSRNVHEYVIPPLTDVRLEFDPVDLRDYTLTFLVPKSIDVVSMLAMKKLCDVDDSQIFQLGSLTRACVTVDGGEKTDTENEVTIESMFAVRRAADAGHMFEGELGNPDRCGCP